MLEKLSGKTVENNTTPPSNATAVQGSVNIQKMGYLSEILQFNRFDYTDSFLGRMILALVGMAGFLIILVIVVIILLCIFMKRTAPKKKTSGSKEYVEMK